MESTARKSKNLRRLIVILSVVIPLVVAVLFKVKIEGVDLTFLPPIYAGINGVTAVLLLIALLFIKQKKVKLHERVIRICLFLSLLFLASYVAYHMTSDSAIYGGSLGMLYYPLLISHIVLSIAVVPLVLYSFLLGLEGQFDKHRKWTKFTWPIWFYVAVSGVIVYFMISPYYA
jgi:putative membrane protein